MVAARIIDILFKIKKYYFLGLRLFLCSLHHFHFFEAYFGESRGAEECDSLLLLKHFVYFGIGIRPTLILLIFLLFKEGFYHSLFYFSTDSSPVNDLIVAKSVNINSF